MRGGDQACLVRASRRHLAGVDGELALGAVRLARPQFVAVGWRDGAQMAPVHFDAAAQVDEVAVEGLKLGNGRSGVADDQRSMDDALFEVLRHAPCRAYGRQPVSLQ